MADISRNGKRPPPWERGFEDTWRLDPGEYVDVAATFTDYPGLFMVHCHMLDHEDHGMMAQFEVLEQHAADRDPIRTDRAGRSPPAGPGTRGWPSLAS